MANAHVGDSSVSAASFSGRMVLLLFLQVCCGAQRLSFLFPIRELLKLTVLGSELPSKAIAAKRKLQLEFFSPQHEHEESQVKAKGALSI